MTIATLPALICCRSDRPATVADFVYIDRPELTIGKRQPGQPDPDIALDPQHEDLRVSHQHARLSRQGDSFTLSVASNHGVQYYEKALSPGEARQFELFDYFTIPARRELGKPYYRFLFVPNLPTEHREIYRSSARPLPVVPLTSSNIQVYNTWPKITDKPYLLLKYLYDHRNEQCAYGDLYEVIWPDEKERKLISRPDLAIDRHVLALARVLRTRKRDDTEQELARSATHCFLEFTHRKSVKLCLDPIDDLLINHLYGPLQPRRLGS